MRYVIPTGTSFTFPHPDGTTESITDGDRLAELLPAETLDAHVANGSLHLADDDVADDVVAAPVVVAAPSAPAPNAPRVVSAPSTATTAPASTD